MKELVAAAMCPKCRRSSILGYEDVTCVAELNGNFTYFATCPNSKCGNSFEVKLGENVRLGHELTAEDKTDWFGVLAKRLRDYSEGSVWSSGDEILCKTESAADAMADLLESLYRSEEQDVLVNTGYYDPEEDKKAGECDRYTGWWYVNVD